MNLLRNMLREKVQEQIGDFDRNSIERVRESEWKGDEANVRFVWWNPLLYKVIFLFFYFIFIHKPMLQ